MITSGTAVDSNDAASIVESTTMVRLVWTIRRIVPSFRAIDNARTVRPSPNGVVTRP